MLAGLAALVFVSLGHTDGKLVYALDDPYIHMAVAESIANGEYGINAGEYSSPSSSILFPFLLVLTNAIGFGETGPLALGALGAGGSAWVFGGLLWRHVHRSGSLWSLVSLLAILPMLFLASNLYALPLTGMEHTLHIWTSVLIVAGLFEMRRNEPVPLALVSGIVLAPLLRFEGVALAGAGILALAWLGRGKTAALIAAQLGFVLALYAAAMIAAGLPPLPSSVLVKSHVTAAFLEQGAGPAAEGMVRTIPRTLNDRMGTILLMGSGLLALVAALGRHASSGNRITVALCVTTAIGAHAMIGRFGWFSRYEVYAVASLLAALICLAGPVSLQYWFNRLLSTLGALVILAVVGFDYAGTTLKTPLASRNIYDQQYQMHRFATEFFPTTVAVNDIGYVSYKNENYLLDLIGLGSEAARRQSSRDGRTPGFLFDMAKAAGATYAMIYADWFNLGVPEEWCRIALLNTIEVTAFREVEFHLIDRTAEAEMRIALEDWQRTLPSGSSLEILACT